jgi:hypothetical protein
MIQWCHLLRGRGSLLVSELEGPCFRKYFICVVAQIWFMVEISSIYIVCFVGAQEILDNIEWVSCELFVRNPAISPKIFTTRDSAAQRIADSYRRVAGPRENT